MYAQKKKQKAFKFYHPAITTAHFSIHRYIIYSMIIKENLLYIRYHSRHCGHSSDSNRQNSLSSRASILPGMEEDSKNKASE